MTDNQLYQKYSKYYDKIYANVNYHQECEFIRWAVGKHKQSKGIKLLDVACGTGTHADILKNTYEVTGVDINEDMLEIAAAKVPNVTFIKEDMKNLDLDTFFDVVTCIFSSINYNRNYNELEITLTNFYDHMVSGGVLIYDLSINTTNWIEGLVSVDTVVEEELNIARICQSQNNNGIFDANFILLVKDHDKFDFDIDKHELGVFNIVEVNDLMDKIGFKTFIYGDFTDEIWEAGKCQRPIFVGIKPQIEGEKI